MFDQLQKLKQLQDMDEEELIETGLVRAEEGLLKGLEMVAEDVDEKRADDWDDRDEVRERLAAMDADQHKEQYRRVMEAVEKDVARVFVTYHEMVLYEEGVRNFLDAIGTLLVSLHSPIVQESLLIPVRSPYRNEVREQFQEFGAMLWGWAEVTAGEEGEHAEAYLAHAAERWQTDAEELTELVFAEE